MNWRKTLGKWVAFAMTAVGFIIVIEPLLVLSSPPVASTTPPEYNMQRYAEYLSQSVRIEATCPEDWVKSNLENPACYKYFANEMRFVEAEHACFQGNGHLAVAETQQELDFLFETRWKITDEIDFWIGYRYNIYSHRVNKSNWSEVHRTQPLDSEQVARLEAYRLGQPELSDHTPLLQQNNTAGLSKLCARAKVSENFKTGINLSNCKSKTGYLCQKDVDYICLDGTNQYKSGERFSIGMDKCTSCTCGKSMNCMSTMCAQPSCDRFIPDDLKCCKYTCIWDTDENLNGKTGIESNMQWMLTMAFSFFILGVVLIMIYRMRQKRMAFLRFRREHLQQLSQITDFEPGSGPPPPPDDFDGFHEPPPPYTSPYTYYKDERVDLPPPYEQLTITLPTVNTNNRKTEDTGETVTLLGDSEPSTPSVQSADMTLTEAAGTTANHQNTNRLEHDNNSSNSPGDNSITSSSTATGSHTSQDSNTSTSTIFQTSV